MSLRDEALSYCRFCNLSVCSCLAFTDKTKIYHGIEQVCVKRRNWITRVLISLQKEQFSAMKQKLGTGGTYFRDRVQLRGKIRDRVQRLLQQIGFKKVLTQVQ